MTVKGSGVSFWGGENGQELDTVMEAYITL